MNTVKGLSGVLIACASVLLLVVGCGPTYPDCFNDEDCAKQGQFCVDGTCSQCRDDSHCNGSNACRVCEGAACATRPNCCTTDADCPNGSCWMVAGRNYGECGAECGPGKACPPGQRCNAQGACEPDAACGPNSPCPPGQMCDGGQCVAGCALQTVYFDFNESRVRLDQQESLNGNAECIKKRGQGVQVQGHCDERGTEEYNMALGEKRAIRSKRYLSTLGVSDSSLSVMSYGEERPTCTQSNEGCWSQNRRAEFIFQ
ncbi:MAG: OmpA family protein [Myxococcota bacterium]|nr:OmpA family protein [Myxococcota bacterium]